MCLLTKVGMGSNSPTSTIFLSKTYDYYDPLIIRLPGLGSSYSINKLLANWFRAEVFDLVNNWLW